MTVVSQSIVQGNRDFAHPPLTNGTEQTVPEIMAGESVFTGCASLLNNLARIPGKVPVGRQERINP